MRIAYDQETKAIYIEVRPTSNVVVESEEHGDVLLDISSIQEVVGIELLGVEERPEIIVRHDDPPMEGQISYPFEEVSSATQINSSSSHHRRA